MVSFLSKETFILRLYNASFSFFIKEKLPQTAHLSTKLVCTFPHLQKPLSNLTCLPLSGNYNDIDNNEDPNIFPLLNKFNNALKDYKIDTVSDINKLLSKEFIKNLICQK